MNKRRTIIILSLIVLLPLIIYTSYEISSLNENEEIVEEIFQQQMNLILRAVNKNAWNAATDWTNKIDGMNLKGAELNSEEIKNFFTDYNFINAVMVTDTSLTSPSFYSRLINSDTGVSERIINVMQKNQNLLKRLINRKETGYEKIESLKIENELTEDGLLLVHLLETPRENYQYSVFLLDIGLFIEDVIKPNFKELARDEFIIALFHQNKPEPVYSTDYVESYKVKLNRRVWLLPEYHIGIALKNNLLKDLAINRFERSLFLISFLTLILIAAVFYLFRNITKQIELAKMKTDFVSNVSHELRTPLALIRMFAETIEMGRTENEEETKEFCNIINNESKRLTLLINRILDFSKIDAGEKKYSIKEINLNKVVLEIIRFYKYHLENNGFDLSTEIYKNELIISADENAIAETLVNLLDNAMKYCKEDEKTITLRTGHENDTAFIEIEDRGIGIPENQQKKIFEKFYRVENSLTSSKRGSGLGLSLVKHIMDAHNGSIKLFSNTEEGSRFRLEFPLKSNINATGVVQ